MQKQTKFTSNPDLKGPHTGFPKIFPQIEPEATVRLKLIVNNKFNKES